MTADGRTSPAPAGVRPGGLPLAWETRIDPDRVVVHVEKPGNPVAKQRPRSGRNGNVYTPAATRAAQEEWQWVMRSFRQYAQPVVEPVGVLVLFRLADARPRDIDNLAKLVLDAGNSILWVDDQQVTEVHLHLVRGCAEASSELLVWIRG